MQLRWVNVSPDTLTSLHFYMYLNAFKDTLSTFLKGSNGSIFGRPYSQRSPEEWGHITAHTIADKRSGESLASRYIQPDDGNEHDQSVLEVLLGDPLMPGESIELSIDFVAKMPKTIARAGYSRDDFYLFVHWFPQPGVYEQNEAGVWGWNCHQFFRQTEFYADFGSYDVRITLPDHLVLGASGCKLSAINHGNGTKTVRYAAHDVIDFAWTVYPYFEEYTDHWRDVEIRMLIPPEHCAMAPRYSTAIKNALNYFADYIAPYPYPSITLVDPPMHGLSSGFMEYPMLITCASFHFVPKGIRTIESLAIHEFSHQYFMGILASNEKEAAWLDEGFVTFFEDDIMDYFEGDRTSIFDIWGYRSGNAEQSRLEYTSLDDVGVEVIAKPGWLFKGPYKAIIYGKTATVLQTLKGMVGKATMQRIIQHYYEENKFKHPREADFIRAVKEIAGSQIKGMPVDSFFYYSLHTGAHCDFQIDHISEEQIDGHYTTNIKMSNTGRFFLPNTVRITYADGSTTQHDWDSGKSRLNLSLNGKHKVIGVDIDPERAIRLDLNFNNNSISQNISRRPFVNYGNKGGALFQSIVQLISFLL